MRRSTRVRGLERNAGRLSLTGKKVPWRASRACGASPPGPASKIAAGKSVHGRGRVAHAEGRSNAQTWFEIGRIPSDNHIRDMLVEPAMRQAFARSGGRTLIAWDGTEYFCSQKLDCPNCLTRKRSNGKTYHCLLSATVVARGHSKVVALKAGFVAARISASSPPGSRCGEIVRRFTFVKQTSQRDRPT